MLAYLQQQYGTVTANFTDNGNVHDITVTYRSGSQSTGTGALRFSDGEAISAVATAASAGPTQVVAQYRIPFGLTGTDDHTYFVEGLGPGGAALLGVPAMRDGVALGATTRPHTVIQVRVVQAHGDGGMSSDRLEPVTLDLEALPPKPPLAVFGTLDPATLDVDEATFARLISLVDGGDDWTTFRTRHDGTTNPYGFDAVAAYYVHVDNLADVDRVGHALEDAGYSTTYILRAFDDLAGTLSGGVGGGLVLILGTLVLCLVVTFTNLQAYLNLAHRDMGILKHVGYPPGRVQRIYRRRLLTMVGWAAVPAAVLTLAAAVSTLRDHRLYVVLDLCAVVLLMSAVYAVMAGVQLPRHVRRPVLALLKLDRQYE